MEKKNEDLKVVHSQYARILKEEDEIWISSEDLNTENSSDDERLKTKQAYKKKLKIKHRKRSTPNIRIQRASIPSIPSTSSCGVVDDRLLMPKSDELHSRSDDSRTSDEEYSLPPVSPECLSKRFSLEDWRPMKGALNISSLEDAASSVGRSIEV